MTDENAKDDEVRDPYASDPPLGEADPGDEDPAPAVVPGDPPEEDDDEEGEDVGRPTVAEPVASQERKGAVGSTRSEEPPAEAPLDPRKFLDEELATKFVEMYSEQQRKIARLEAMLDGAGIMAPQEAAVSRIGEQFPDVFGGKGTPATAEQSEARRRLSESADVLRGAYHARGRKAPGWDELMRVAMSVEFPDLATKAVAMQAKASRRESQRIARPASREVGLSPEERAVRAARKLMLESAAFADKVPSLE